MRTHLLLQLLRSYLSNDLAPRITAVQSVRSGYQKWRLLRGLVAACLGSLICLESHRCKKLARVAGPIVMKTAVRCILFILISMHGSPTALRPTRCHIEAHASFLQNLIRAHWIATKVFSGTSMWYTSNRSQVAGWCPREVLYQKKEGTWKN